MSNPIIDKLTAKGSGEQAKFLNDIIVQLWPNITAMTSQMTKEIVEPMFKTMLPGPLKSLHFTKLNLGDIPLKLSNVLTTKSDTGAIKLDMNVDWDGDCDIELDADLIPTLGVESVKLHGRLSILLGPLTNVIPLIGAAQIAFVNPPVLKLDFTGAANVADFSAVDGAVRGIILSVLNGMFTLPNRFLVKLDANADYFATYLYPLGVIRITVEKATGFAHEAKSGAKKLFSKLTRASPDCYVKVDVGAEPTFKTATKSNTTSPVWNETHDFVVSDLDQCIKLSVEDEDVGSDDAVGLAVTTVREALLAAGRQELSLTKDNQPVAGTLTIASEFHPFEAGDASFSASAESAADDGRLCGLATILVASAYGIKGQREQLRPSVKVSLGAKHHFQTAIKEDAPGTDISNPAFDQNFRVPVTADMASSGQAFRIALLDGEKEVGAVEVPWADVVRAPGMTVGSKFDVGGGATVRASIKVAGVGVASTGGASLPRR
ncbi:hypothetical protein LTR08_004092 [Meristemomyces frigidus]|nr:hypothetical protein LTR08_004092 [Meristemomyces frigidus]